MNTFRLFNQIPNVILNYGMSYANNSFIPFRRLIDTNDLIRRDRISKLSKHPFCVSQAGYIIIKVSGVLDPDGPPELNIGFIMIQT